MEKNGKKKKSVENCKFKTDKWKIPRNESHAPEFSWGDSLGRLDFVILCHDAGVSREVDEVYGVVVACARRTTVPV